MQVIGAGWAYAARRSPPRPRDGADPGGAGWLGLADGAPAAPAPPPHAGGGRAREAEDDTEPHTPRLSLRV